MCAQLNNICVMVFLREFLACTIDEDRRSAFAAQRKCEELEDDVMSSSPLELLLQDMFNFNDAQELDEMIKDLYNCIQPAPGEKVGFSQLQNGLRPARIHINHEDWQQLTKGILRPGKDLLDESDFRQMMRKQLALFASRELINLMGITSSSSNHGDHGLPPIALQRYIKMLSPDGVEGYVEGKQTERAAGHKVENKGASQLRMELRRVQDENR